MARYTLQDKCNFIEKLYDYAKPVSEASGISLQFILAQSAAEVSWGRSIYGNNLFNIEADKGWTGPTATNPYDGRVYRAYSSWEESMNDYLSFLQNNSRYSRVFDIEVRGNVEKLAKAVADAGYAERADYASFLIGVAKGPTMRMALRQYDPGPNSIWNDNPVNSARSAYGQGQSIPFSPLVLDLNGDGVKTTGLTDGAYFDHDKNGFAEQTGWATSDEGLLVLDRNSDGIINDGGELFGNGTTLQNGQQATDGFQALAELDSNYDGIIDANDSAFSRLKIWQDIDGDGYSSSDELHTLDESGIQSIITSVTTSGYVDPQGNEHRLIGSFTKTDGTTSTMDDIWFKTDKTYTIANDWLDVPDDIAALPDLQGYGTVYDLHQAMVRDNTGQLKSLVEQFAAATDTAARNDLMDQIIFKWTGSESVDPDGRGPYVDAR
jgi:hypothetical protein